MLVVKGEEVMMEEFSSVKKIPCVNQDVVSLNVTEPAVLFI